LKVKILWKGFPNTKQKFFCGSDKEGEPVWIGRNTEGLVSLDMAEQMARDFGPLGALEIVDVIPEAGEDLAKPDEAKVLKRLRDNLK